MAGAVGAGENSAIAGVEQRAAADVRTGESFEDRRRHADRTMEDARGQIRRAAMGLDRREPGVGIAGASEPGGVGGFSAGILLRAGPRHAVGGGGAGSAAGREHFGSLRRAGRKNDVSGATHGESWAYPGGGPAAATVAAPAGELRAAGGGLRGDHGRRPGGSGSVRPDSGGCAVLEQRSVAAAGRFALEDPGGGTGAVARGAVGSAPSGVGAPQTRWPAGL